VYAPPAQVSNYIPVAKMDYRATIAIFYCHQNTDLNDNLSKTNLPVLKTVSNFMLS